LTKHWNARNSPNRSEKNNINGRWSSYFTGTTLLLQRIISHSEQNAIFEILKGGSQIQYGPYTTGGAINMVSTQIPDVFQAVLLPA
jgi:outer membrane receptor protein involved in Fe transport